MIRVRAGGREITASAFIFDKDGLMFESQRFWQELVDGRLVLFSETEDEGFLSEWCRVLGVTRREDGRAAWGDPKGIFAVASVPQEMAVTAALIVQRRGIPWAEAYGITVRAFQEADRNLDLSRALQPRKGFPEILRRLRERAILYGIATSDTLSRALVSLRMFDDPEGPAFILTPADVDHGKPAPDMLLRSAERLGMSPEDIIMVGDSYVDMEMAARAGSSFIGVPETDEMRLRMASQDAVIAEDFDEIVFL